MDYPRSKIGSIYIIYIKASSILDKLNNSKSVKDKSKTKKFKKKQDTPRYDTWKFKKLKHGTLSTKVVKDKTYYWYDKLHEKVGKPMWVLHKPSEYKEYSKRLKQLMNYAYCSQSIKRIFKRLETKPANFKYICWFLQAIFNMVICYSNWHVPFVGSTRRIFQWNSNQSNR